MKQKVLVEVAIGVLFLVLGGIYLNFPGEKTSHKNHQIANTVWTCAMHPQIKMPNPGNCPICWMELIPLKIEGGNGNNVSSLKLSPRAQKLAEVETTVVKRREARLDISLYGKLEFDESRVAHITSRTPGRIERLFLDFTGVAVNKGDHMVELYSPELVTAQEELIQATQAIQNMREGASESLRKIFQDNLKSAKEKLLLWGLSAKQVDEIAKSGEPKEVLTINAPIGGVVIHKDAIEGRYVKEGTKIYTIADLRELWLMLDAYESDLIWLRQGQEIRFKAEAIPGMVFTGMISFIDPVINEKKRTVRIRANVNNEEEVLKPGMFVRASVHPQVGGTGRVVSKTFGSKWMGAMHPQVVRNAPGTCPICGMDLVTAESLGYFSSDSEKGQLPLLIPATAPLITGKRAIVFIEEPESPGTYAARLITLGPRAGDDYIVYEGLAEGERVVSKGNFKIDSASQILAKPSMMMPSGGSKSMKGHSH